MRFHRLFGSASCRFFEFLGACCLKNARGAGTCSFNNLKLTLLYGKRPMTICQLRHTIVRNAFLNFIVVELMRCYFRLTRAQRMPTCTFSL